MKYFYIVKKPRNNLKLLFPLSRKRERARVRVGWHDATLIRPIGHLLPPAGEGRKPVFRFGSVIDITAL